MNYVDMPLPANAGYARLWSNDDTYFATITYYRVSAGGTPYVVTLDPPVGPINSLSLGDVYNLVMSNLPA